MWQRELGVAQYSDFYQKAGNNIFLTYATALKYSEGQTKGICLSAARLWTVF